LASLQCDSLFGPKEIHCSQKCCVSLSSDMARCIIREEVYTPSVPYGDTFSCVSYTDVRSGTCNDQSCLVSITAFVVFSKQPNYLISGKIVSEAHKDYSDSAALWKNMALSHCRDSAAILSDFRALTRAQLPSVSDSQCDARDISSLQQLSTRLSRALSRTASAESLGSDSRRNSEISRAGVGSNSRRNSEILRAGVNSSSSRRNSEIPRAGHFRTSRQGSFSQDSSIYHEPAIAISTRSLETGCDDSLIHRPHESLHSATTSGLGRAEVTSSASGAMSNSR
jgi:hypothetical protein